MADSTRYKITADASQFTSEMQKTAKAATDSQKVVKEKTKETVAAVENLNKVKVSDLPKSITDAGTKTVAALDNVAARVKEISGEINASIASIGNPRNTNSAQMTKELDKNIRQLQANIRKQNSLQGLLDNSLGTKSGHDEGGHGLSQMQRQRATARYLDNPTGTNLRAYESFATTIPGISKALDVAFPVIGALAFAGVIKDLVQGVIEFVHNLNNLPNAIHAAFDPLIDASRLSADQTAVENDKIRDRIALLEHKPQNGAALALDEARVKADEFGASLVKDKKEMDDIFKNQAVGLGGFLFGKATTKGLTDELGGKMAAVTADARDERQATQRGDLTAAAAAHQKSIKDLGVLRDDADTDATTRKTQDDALRAQGPQVYERKHVDASAKDAIDAAVAEFASTKLDSIKQDDDQVGLTKKLKSDEDAKKRLEDAKEAQAAAKQVQEQRLRDLESGAQSEEAIYGKGIYHARTYWAQYLNTFAKGSSEANAVLAKFNAADATQFEKNPLQVKADENNKRDKEQREADAKELVRGSDIADELSKTASEDTLHTGSRYTQFRAEQYKSEAAPDEQKIAVQEANLAIAESTGTISRQGVALQQAAIHAAQYAARVKEIKAQLDDLPNQGLSSKDLQTQTLALKTEGVKLDDQNAIQQIQDMAAETQTSLTAAFDNSLNHFVQHSQDTAAQIGNIFTDALGTVNDTLATDLTAHYRTGRERTRALRNGLSSDVRGVGSSVAKAGLEKAEGGLLGSLGFGGKPDGSQSKPLWVKMAGALGLGGAASGTSSASGSGSGGSSIVSSLASGFKGLGSDGSDSDSDTGGGSGLSAVLGAAFQGAFAEGGDVSANRPALIGEKGPEIFVPKSAGSIIPNSAMGGGNHTFMVDARGSSNPAETERMVNRALRQATPQIIAAANGYGKEANRRLPSSKRQ